MNICVKMIVRPILSLFFLTYPSQALFKIDLRSMKGALLHKEEYGTDFEFVAKYDNATLNRPIFQFSLTSCKIEDKLQSVTFINSTGGITLIPNKVMEYNNVNYKKGALPGNIYYADVFFVIRAFMPSDLPNGTVTFSCDLKLRRDGCIAQKCPLDVVEKSSVEMNVTGSPPNFQSTSETPVNISSVPWWIIVIIVILIAVVILAIFCTVCVINKLQAKKKGNAAKVSGYFTPQSRFTGAYVSGRNTPMPTPIPTPIQVPVDAHPSPRLSIDGTFNNPAYINY